jgi:hypothetical protein
MTEARVKVYVLHVSMAPRTVKHYANCCKLFEQAFQHNFRSKMVTLLNGKFALIVFSQFLGAMNREPTVGFDKDIEICDQDLHLFAALWARKREITLAVESLIGRSKEQEA